MTATQKQSLIAEVVTLLQTKLDDDVKAETSKNISGKSTDDKIEMLTIKECCKIIRGLSEHTVRQLVKQDKISYIRSGAGRNGKILISRTALTNYFSEKSQ